MKKLMIAVVIMFLFCVTSCKCNNNNNNSHEHNFVEGKCECGELDPNYNQNHTHNFVDGKCSCGAVDPNYNQSHTHSYVDGKCSCGAVDPNYNNGGDNETEYEFVTKEEIEKLFNVYYTQVELVDENGSKSSFVMSENNKYFYYKYKDSNILIEKDNNSIYTIDDDLKIKTLEKQLEFDIAANKKVLLDLLSQHIDKIDKKFSKKEDTKVGEFDCEFYTKTITVDANNYAEYKYYIDKETGGCIKTDIKTCLAGKVVSSICEFKQLLFDESIVNSFINKYSEYTTEIAPLEYVKWPNEGLTLLLPEYLSGEFSFGIDYGNRVKIVIENTRSSHVQDYVNSLTGFGFEEGKSKTNEASQFIYVTYNSDNILVKIIFSKTVSQLEINISQSTKEEINKELSKL